MNAISHTDIVACAKDYFKEQLSKALELAFLLPTDPAIDIKCEIDGTRQLATQMQSALSKQHFTPSVQSDAMDLLSLINPNAANRSSDAFKFACNAVLRAKLESTRILAAQLAGEYYDTAPKDPWFAGISAVELPAIPGDEQVAPTGPTFGLVAKQFYDFKSKNDWAPKTTADVKRVIALATELVGPDKLMSLLDIDDIKRVRDALATVPPNYMKMALNQGISAKAAIAANTVGKSLSTKTQVKYFAMFRQLVLWSVAEGYLDKAPGTGVKVAGLKKVVAGEQRDPYSPEQLVKIFKSPLFSGHQSIERRHKPGSEFTRDGYYWTPLIALYSGMRLGEILQLLKSDLKNENGVWCFDINKGDGKTLKTASSKRRVPIHGALLDLGFTQHVATSAHSGRIFPEIKIGADGYHSHHFSKWWGRYSKHIGFKSAKTTFHSFRHNFMDALRAAETPEYINKALAGHSDSSVHSQYGGGPSLSQLKAAVDKISYDITLPKNDDGI